MARVAILGTGDVGRALGKGFVATGDEVVYGTRDPRAKKVEELLHEVGPQATATTPADAVRGADWVVLAVLGTAAEEVLRAAGPAHLAGKTILDTTNPLDFSGGMPPRLFVGHTDSLGERVQRAVPRAHVVKVFNTIGNAHMFRPQFPGGPPEMFYCGNDASAKARVDELLRSWGWAPFDLGGIEGARLLEPLCILWVTALMKLQTPNIAFKLLRK